MKETLDDLLYQNVTLIFVKLSCTVLFRMHEKILRYNATFMNTSELDTYSMHICMYFTWRKQTINNYYLGKTTTRIISFWSLNSSFYFQQVFLIHAIRQNPKVSLSQILYHEHQKKSPHFKSGRFLPCHSHTACNKGSFTPVKADDKSTPLHIATKFLISNRHLKNLSCPSILLTIVTRQSTSRSKLQDHYRIQNFTKLQDVISNLGIVNKAFTLE